MSRIRPTWTPANTDSSGDFTIGHLWSASVAVVVEGAWYYRAAGADPPTALTAILYLQSTQAVLASGSAGAPPEGWSFVAFDTPLSASSGVTYVTAVETDGRYGFGLGELGSPITDPDHGVVTIPANGGAFEFGHQFPGSTGDFMHGSDTEFELAATQLPGSGVGVGGAFGTATPAKVGTGAALAVGGAFGTAAPSKVGTGTTAGFGGVVGRAGVRTVRRTRARGFGGVVGRAGVRTVRRVRAAGFGGVVGRRAAAVAGRDLQLVLSPPEVKWSAGDPDTRWVVGVPEAKWAAGRPTV